MGQQCPYCVWSKDTKTPLTQGPALLLFSPPGTVAPSCTSYKLEPSEANRTPPSQPSARGVGGLWMDLDARVAGNCNHKSEQTLPATSSPAAPSSFLQKPHSRPAAALPPPRQPGMDCCSPFLLRERLLPELNFVSSFLLIFFSFSSPYFPPAGPTVVPEWVWAGVCADACRIPTVMCHWATLHSWHSA